MLLFIPAVVTNISQVGDTVSVTTANGTDLTADYVIVTVPLGVLKRESIGFEPPLTADKQVAIKDMVSWIKPGPPGRSWPHLAPLGQLPKRAARLTRMPPSGI